jgi:hypothetical protein
MDPLVSGQVAAGHRVAKGKLVTKFRFRPFEQGQGSEFPPLSRSNEAFRGKMKVIKTMLLIGRPHFEICLHSHVLCVQKEFILGSSCL